MQHLDVDKINGQRIEAYQEVDRLEQELKELTRKYTSLQRRFETQVDTIIRTRTSRDEYRSRLHRAEKTITKLKEKLGNSTAECTGLRFQLNSCKEQLRHARRELAR